MRISTANAVASDLADYRTSSAGSSDPSPVRRSTRQHPPLRQCQDCQRRPMLLLANAIASSQEILCDARSVLALHSHEDNPLRTFTKHFPRRRKPTRLTRLGNIGNGLFRAVRCCQRIARIRLARQAIHKRNSNDKWVQFQVSNLLHAGLIPNSHGYSSCADVPTSWHRIP